VVGDEPSCAGVPTTDGHAEDHRRFDLPIEEDYPACAWEAESAAEDSQVDL
jgi:hypothetical protein